jgi:hypothetical protein
MLDAICIAAIIIVFGLPLEKLLEVFDIVLHRHMDNHAQDDWFHISKLEIF